eukprot:TRINITY_DN19321_c0_g1_i1.p1 TRINITY_DN19321_c0_g1~~TRINITY_DN19321_c0_g1_i1.p1  ORF type:complete len:567 (+),score=92.03 TRINITY_DN19321_c0_g1_i1:134-1702(+)
MVSHRLREIVEHYLSHYKAEFKIPTLRAWFLSVANVSPLSLFYITVYYGKEAQILWNKAIRPNIRIKYYGHPKELPPSLDSNIVRIINMQWVDRVRSLESLEDCNVSMSMWHDIVDQRPLSWPKKEGQNEDDDDDDDEEEEEFYFDDEDKPDTKDDSDDDDDFGGDVILKLFPNVKTIRLTYNATRYQATFMHLLSCAPLLRSMYITFEDLGEDGHSPVITKIWDMMCAPTRRENLTKMKIHSHTDEAQLHSLACRSIAKLTRLEHLKLARIDVPDVEAFVFLLTSLPSLRHLKWVAAAVPLPDIIDMLHYNGKQQQQQSKGQLLPLLANMRTLTVEIPITSEGIYFDLPFPDDTITKLLDLMPCLTTLSLAYILPSSSISALASRAPSMMLQHLRLWLDDDIDMIQLESVINNLPFLEHVKLSFLREPTGPIELRAPHLLTLDARDLRVSLVACPQLRRVMTAHLNIIDHAVPHMLAYTPLDGFLLVQDVPDWEAVAGWTERNIETWMAMLTPLCEKNVTI